MAKRFFYSPTGGYGYDEAPLPGEMPPEPMPGAVESPGGLPTGPNNRMFGPTPAEVRDPLLASIMRRGAQESDAGVFAASPRETVPMGGAPGPGAAMPEDPYERALKRLYVDSPGGLQAARRMLSSPTENTAGAKRLMSRLGEMVYAERAQNEQAAMAANPLAGVTPAQASIMRAQMTEQGRAADRAARSQGLQANLDSKRSLLETSLQGKLDAIKAAGGVEEANMVMEAMLTRQQRLREGKEVGSEAWDAATQTALASELAQIAERASLEGDVQKELVARRAQARLITIQAEQTELNKNPNIASDLAARASALGRDEEQALPAAPDWAAPFQSTPLAALRGEGVSAASLRGDLDADGVIDDAERKILAGSRVLLRPNLTPQQRQAVQAELDQLIASHRAASVVQKRRANAQSQRAG